MVEKNPVAEKSASVSSIRLIAFISGLILFVSGIIFLLNVHRYQNFILDDAYITYRFARHLADGDGLVWNIGGETVEGYTSLLHVGLVAFSFMMGFQPEVASTAFSIGCVLATVGLILFLLRRHSKVIYPQIMLIIGLYLIDRVTALNTVKGLETQLFTFLLCLVTILALLAVDSPNKKSIYLALSFVVFLSILARPEGVIYGGVVYLVLAAYLFIRVRRVTLDKRAGYGLIISIGVLALLGLGYAAWKLGYFGYLLPNTYYVKSNSISLSGLTPVGKYLEHLAAWYVPLVLGFVLFTKSRFLRLSTYQLMALTKASLVLGPAVAALIYYITITHEVGGDYRFSYPTYPSFIIAVAAFIGLVSRSSIPRDLFTRRLVFVSALALIILLSTQESWKVLLIYPTVDPVGEFNEYHLKIADALQSSGLGPKAILLNDAAGIIPYISEFNQIDRVGLVDNTLSGRVAMSPSERDRYLWDQHADVYIGYEPPASALSDGIQNDPIMQSSYVNDVLLVRPSAGVIAQRIFAGTPEQLYRRMEELRENWYLVGEIEWAGCEAWGLRSYVYVRDRSTYFDQLVNSLNSIVDIPADQLLLDAPC